MNGSAVVIAPACRALRTVLPPPNSSTAATRPSMLAQKMRCATGACSLPPAVIVSMTSDPESEDVIKKISSRITANAETICCHRQIIEHME